MLSGCPGRLYYPGLRNARMSSSTRYRTPTRRLGVSSCSAFRPLGLAIFAAHRGLDRRNTLSLAQGA